MAGAEGVAKIDMTDAQVQLLGINTVVGRSMVVHEKEDDLGACYFMLHNYGTYFHSRRPRRGRR